MASVAAAALASLSSSLSSSLFFKPSLSLIPIRTLPRITCSLSTSSSSSSSLEFNISFAPPKPKSKPKSDASEPDPEALAGQLIIPWIVRGEDGNLKLQSHPPARFLQAIETKTKTKKKKEGAEKRVPTAEPKYSKAARRFYNENFRDASQRLGKVLAAAGGGGHTTDCAEGQISTTSIAFSVEGRCSCTSLLLHRSASGSEQLIFDGKVTVNGSVCNTPQTRVDPGRDIIYVNGNRLPKRLPPKVYLALNKPKGYICASGENKSVLSLFEDYLKTWDKRNSGIPRPRLFTVGRLDVATTGLIIVTNDGDFAQKISHPSSNLSKEYIAAIEGVVSKRHLLAISEGTVIEGVHCTPDSVELLPQQPDMSRPRLRIVVHEGRNHEVRELVKNAGLEIHSLKRVRIGGFRLPSDLGLGKHMALKQGDLSALGWKS